MTSWCASSFISNPKLLQRHATRCCALRREEFIHSIVATMVVSCSTSIPVALAFTQEQDRTTGYPTQHSEEEWSSLLRPTQYDILRLGKTERPFSSILEGEERVGTYLCAGCGNPLFQSQAKFHSGTGWPSFASALKGVSVESTNSFKKGLLGAELRCNQCGGHLGDVFQDGFLFVGTPAFQTGERYCIDGAALVFHTEEGSFLPGDS
jgi:peptide-methionine (R)-S-oxide reductase